MESKSNAYSTAVEQNSDVKDASPVGNESFEKPKIHASETSKEPDNSEGPALDKDNNSPNTKDEASMEDAKENAEGEKSNSAPVDDVKKGKGRRGDPRMHRAVAARLAKPQLSLFQALVAGGFKFPVSEIASKGNGPIYDSDNVLLSQRKNQLSRRLRLLARRRQSHQMALNASSAATNTGMSLDKSNKIVSAIEANNNLLFGYPPMQYPTVPGGGGFPGMNAFQHQMHMQSLFQQQDMVRSSAAAAALQLNKLQANPALMGYPGLAGAQIPSGANLSGIDNAANPTPRVPNAVPATSNPEAMYKMRLENAVQFYKSEKENLKKRALLAAGFTEKELEAVKEEYQRKLSEAADSSTATAKSNEDTNGKTNEKDTETSLV